MATYIKRFNIERNMDGWDKDRACRNLDGMEAALCQQYDDWEAATRPGRVINFAVDRGINNALGYVRFVVVWG